MEEQRFLKELLPYKWCRSRCEGNMCQCRKNSLLSCSSNCRKTRTRERKRETTKEKEEIEGKKEGIKKETKKDGKE
jgi:hypothetical protein